MMRDIRRQNRRPRVLHVVFVAVLTFLFLPSTASAIPAWARRYDVPCSACHYPAPPRLNAYGHKFRRAQYRLSDEIDKEPEWQKLQNYLAARIKGSYSYSSSENPPSGSSTSEESTFALDEASLWYAGPVTKHFTGFLELGRPGDSSEVEAVAWVGGVKGKADSFATFRLGQIETLTGGSGWGGLDRSTGISSPDALSMDLTTGAAGLSSGTEFALDQTQVGVEGTFVHKNWRVIGQVTNGPDTASRTADHVDDNKEKDGFLAYELMWGETASGLTAFAYRGVQDDPAIIGPLDDRLVLERFGLTAAQVWKNGFEVQCGYVLARDSFSRQIPGVQEDISGSGYWVELEKYFSKASDLTILGRFDETDGNSDVSNDNRTKVTGGVVWPLGDWHARLAVELRHIRQESPDPLIRTLSSNEAVAELTLSF